MNETPISSTYERPAIESSSDVAGLLTFKSHKSNRPKGGGQSNHS
jgi:hypothetical protein